METETTGGNPQGSTDSARQQSRRLADEARQRSQQMLHQQQSRAAESLEQFAEALRGSADQMADKDQEVVARYARQAADTLSRYSGTVRDADISTLMQRTSQFAREQPGLFLGGALALGFLGARFLKSSEQAGSSFQGGSLQDSMRHAMGGRRRSADYSDRSHTTAPAEHVDATSGHHMGPERGATRGDGP